MQALDVAFESCNNLSRSRYGSLTPFFFLFSMSLPPSLLRPSVTHSIPFLFSTQKGDELPLQTLRIGTAVDDLVVSGAGHLALRLNPQDWHRETNWTEDIPVRLRARRTRQDPRTGRLLLSTVTVLINSRCFSSASAQKVSRSYDEHQRQCLVCSVPCDRCCGCIFSSS